MSSRAASVADDGSDAGDRRRSGRVRSRPNFLVNDKSGSAKRKRDAAQEDGEEEEQDDDVNEEGSDEEDDEDEVSEVEAPRSVRKSAKPPAPKKPRTNGTTARIPIRGTTTKARKPSKKVLTDAEAGLQEGATGLYKDLLFGDATAEEAADSWLQRFSNHESMALAEIVNFVLKASGCESTVDHHDIENVDGATSRLGDVQDAFEAQGVTDYPLTVRSRFAGMIRKALTDFFTTLIKTLDATNVLFDNVELIENIQVWLSAMTAAQSRPFRHTASVASFAIMTALAELGRDLAAMAAQSRRQSENMSKAKGGNKRRVSEIQESAKADEQKRALLDALIKDWFETIYVHRYRDVDFKIRTDCIQALGGWISTYPDVFFDGGHLRYLGWELADSHVTARHEALKQLHKLYTNKNRLAGLKVFTERFRARMVEMATLDSDQAVRASAVALLDLLRQAGFLEPDDIDAVGRLIFDSDERVRLAVVPFFAASVNDLFESKVEDIGSKEAIEEEIGEAADSTDTPGLPWLELKAYAEILEAYDSFDAELPDHIARGQGNTFHLHAGDIQPRFITVSRALYSTIRNLEDWESIASYLLYDFSSADPDANDGDMVSKFAAGCKFSDREGLILIETLNVSFAQHISTLDTAIQEKKGKKASKDRADLVNELSTSTEAFAKSLPELLKRYGDSAKLTLAVLRLERLLAASTLVEAQIGASVLKPLLDEVEKTFKSHHSEDIISEAGQVLLRLSLHDELKDLVDERIEDVWSEVIAECRRLVGDKDTSVRDSLDANTAGLLQKTIYRLSRLATISDPTPHLEAVAPASKGKKNTAQHSTLSLLQKMIRRGIVDDGYREDTEFAATEDALAQAAASTVSIAALWEVSSMKKTLETSAVTDEEADIFTGNRDALLSGLADVVGSRSPSSTIAIEFADLLLDAYTSAAVLRQVVKKSSTDLDLIRDVPKDVLVSVFRVLTSCEKKYASKSGHKIDRPKETARKPKAPVEIADDAEPLDEDEQEAAQKSDAEEDSDDVPSLVSDSGDEENADGEESQARAVKRETAMMQSQLLAEKRLCELGSKLVLALIAGVVDEKTTRKRLELNKTKLGSNWKAVCQFLEKNAPAAKKKVQKAAPKKVVPSKKSEPVVVEDDSEGDDGDADENMEDGADGNGEDAEEAMDAD